MAYDKKSCGKYQRTTKGQFSRLKARCSHERIKFSLTLEEFIILRRYPCVYCGGPLSEASHSLDRLDPGGPYSKDNVVACCWSCNKARGDNVDRLEVILFGAIKRALKVYSELKKRPNRKKNAV